MSRTQSLNRKFGRLELPLSATSDNDLSSLDPAREILLDCLAAAINSELEPRWERAVAGTPLENTSPVEFKFPALLSEENLQQFKPAWPMLAVSRKQLPNRREQVSLEYSKLTDRWDIDYILGPLSLTSSLKVIDALSFVEKIIILTIERQGHKAYATDANGYALSVLGDDGDASCGFYSLRVVESQKGAAAFAQDGPRYNALGLTLESEELATYLPDDDDGESAPLVGATLSASLTQSGDPKVEVRG